MTIVITATSLDQNKREHDSKNNNNENDAANDAPLYVLLFTSICFFCCIETLVFNRHTSTGIDNLLGLYMPVIWIRIL